MNCFCLNLPVNDLLGSLLTYGAHCIGFSHVQGQFWVLLLLVCFAHDYKVREFAKARRDSLLRIHFYRDCTHSDCSQTNLPKAVAA